MKNRLSLILFILLFLQCSNNQVIDVENLILDIPNCKITSSEDRNKDYQSENEKNSLLIVGHAYGKPGVGNFFPVSLTNYIEKNQSKSNNFVVLNGDFVREASEENLNRVKTYIDSKFDGYFISVGNHDINVSYETYIDIFKRDLFHREFNNFLLIAANFSNYNWEPTELQKQNINTIINNSDKKIVILNSHQLFWSEIEGIDISPNSYDLLETELSKTPLEWLEINEDKYLIVISGDYGVPIDQNTSCYSVSNNLFIANGIGDKDNDTIITIKDYDDHLVLKEELLTK
tara:strand:+ start:2153 stop:3019 length:867 start_codon:yes stop_codon:yes gene_type:complete